MYHFTLFSLHFISQYDKHILQQKWKHNIKYQWKMRAWTLLGQQKVLCPILEPTEVFFLASYVNTQYTNICLNKTINYLHFSFGWKNNELLVKVRLILTQMMFLTKMNMQNDILLLINYMQQHNTNDSFVYIIIKSISTIIYQRIEFTGNSKIEALWSGKRLASKSS